MEFLEKDLEDIIFNADKAKLKERGLNIDGVLKRQLRIGSYGIADLVSFDKVYLKNDDGKILPIVLIDVYELKKDELNIHSFSQAVRYCKGLYSYLVNHRGIGFPIFFNINLVGKKIDNRSDLIYYTDLIKSNKVGAIREVNVYTYSYDFEGIQFEKHKNYYKSNEGF